MYGRYPCRSGSTSLTDVTDASPDRGFIVTASPVGSSGTVTLPSWCRQHAPLQQQVPSVRYASTACVQSPSSPSTNRCKGPPVMRKPAVSSGYPGNGCHDSACRLLGNEDSSDWGGETMTTLDDTAYSCADVSAALRDVETPVSVRHQQADVAASSAVNPHQLCDEIDELFFKTWWSLLRHLTVTLLPRATKSVQLLDSSCLFRILRCVCARVFLFCWHLQWSRDMLRKQSLLKHSALYMLCWLLSCKRRCALSATEWQTGVLLSLRCYESCNRLFTWNCDGNIAIRLWITTDAPRLYVEWRFVFISKCFR